MRLRRGRRWPRCTHRLDAVYRRPPAARPADRALAAVVARFALPRALLDALLEGFAWDAAGRRYETLAELERLRRPRRRHGGRDDGGADGRPHPALVARACDLGVAMQLTNIARDVGEDARAGRLYLPQAWLREAGLDPAAWLARPRFSPAIGAAVRRLLAAADTLYARGR